MQVKFIDLFEFYDRTFLPVMSKIDLVPLARASSLSQALQVQLGKSVHCHSIKSKLARQNLLAMLHALQPKPVSFEMPDTKGFFCVLKSFNPNAIGISIHEMTGAVVGGIGCLLACDSQVFIHDLQDLRQSRRVIIKSRIVGIRKDGKPVDHISDTSFHTIELSLCPDFSAQDALSGAILACQKLTPLTQMVGRLVQCYGSIKRKMQIKVQLWGRIIAGQVLSLSKKTIGIKFLRPIYRIPGINKFCMYHNESQAHGLLALVIARP